MEVLLDKKDPQRKALRATERLDKTKNLEAPATADRCQELLEYKKHNTPTLPDRQKREPIPMSIKHRVYLRDEGRCTFTGYLGERCSERKILEFDHVTMICRGGDNSAENLWLRCRYHNQAQAKLELGRSELRSS